MDDLGAQVPLRILEERFPDDAYGRPGLQVVTSDLDLAFWYSYIGLHAMEREFDHLYIASLPGDFSDGTLIGVFGTPTYPCTDEVATCLWWDGGLWPVFSDANEFWAAEEESGNLQDYINAETVKFWGELDRVLSG